MTTRHDHWIEGRPEPPASGTWLATLDPATRLPGDEIAAGGAADVGRAVAAAERARHGWAARSPAERGAVLHRIADAIEADAGTLMRLERECTGKVPAQLRLEADMSAAYFRYYAGVVRAAGHGQVIEQGAGVHTYTRYEPYGVVGVITPWNLPLNQACRALAPALAMGNAVVAKPSEFTSASTLHLARLATRAGLPDGVLNVVTGTGPDAGEALAAHPGVRRLAFTGSVATGRYLAGVAGGRLVPVTLELGGKSPLVVFADADLDRAVAAAVTAVGANSGQVCSATARLLIEESVHDEVVDRVVTAVEKLRPGVDFGPLITEAQYGRVLEFLAGAPAPPATGGGPYPRGPEARGLYIRPTVYARVDPHARIAREEVFGPVLVTLAFRDEAEALALADDTDYGLVAAVWSGDLARGLRLAERIEAGQVAVNGGPLTIETPFGGYRHSGHGREKGLAALYEYAQLKTVSASLG
ncbi:aldehyde dehydrogenase family protein [Streptomyces sp. NPDC058457]|uniref:aldehyde dehydrogenase family protein n=1 Tax=Streptomyces sp. NPDC058457 TaxID=3346507 RepID=UPI0036597A49